MAKSFQYQVQETDGGSFRGRLEPQDLYGRVRVAYFGKSAYTTTKVGNLEANAVAGIPTGETELIICRMPPGKYRFLDFTVIRGSTDTSIQLQHNGYSDLLNRPKSASSGTDDIRGEIIESLTEFDIKLANISGGSNVKPEGYVLFVKD